MDPHLRNIEDLAAKNRLLQLQRQSRQAQPVPVLAAREAGFRVHLQGANASLAGVAAQRAAPVKAKPVVRADHGGPAPSGALHQPPSQSQAPKSGSKWGDAAPLYFATAGGSRMRVVESPAKAFVTGSRVAAPSSGADIADPVLAVLLLPSANVSLSPAPGAASVAYNTATAEGGRVSSSSTSPFRASVLGGPQVSLPALSPSPSNGVVATDAVPAETPAESPEGSAEGYAPGDGDEAAAADGDGSFSVDRAAAAGWFAARQHLQQQPLEDAAVAGYDLGGSSEHLYPVADEGYAGRTFLSAADYDAEGGGEGGGSYEDDGGPEVSGSYFSLRPIEAAFLAAEVQRGLVAPLQAEREVELRRRLAQQPRLEAAVMQADATGGALSPRSEAELALLVQAVMVLPGPDRVRAAAAAEASAPRPRGSVASHHPRPVIAALDSSQSSIPGIAALLAATYADVPTNATAQITGATFDEYDGGNACAESPPGMPAEVAGRSGSLAQSAVSRAFSASVVRRLSTPAAHVRRSQRRPTGTSAQSSADAAIALEPPEVTNAPDGFAVEDDGDGIGVRAAGSLPRWGYDAPSDDSIIAGLLAEHDEAAREQLPAEKSAAPQVWPVPSRGPDKPALVPANPSPPIDTSIIQPRQLNFSSLSAALPPPAWPAQPASSAVVPSARSGPGSAGEVNNPAADAHSSSLRSSWMPLWVHRGAAQMAPVVTGPPPRGAAASSVAPAGTSALHGSLLHAAPLLEEDFEQVLDDLEQRKTSSAAARASNATFDPGAVIGESRGDSLLAMLAADDEDAGLVSNAVFPALLVQPSSLAVAASVAGSVRREARPPAPSPSSQLVQPRRAVTPVLDTTALDATLRDDAPDFAVMPGPAPLLLNATTALRQSLHLASPSSGSPHYAARAAGGLPGSLRAPVAALRSSSGGSSSGGIFETPELPVGRHLRFQLLQTWGDEAWVGLAGIEIFDANGAMLTPAAVSVETWSPAAGSLPTAVTGTEPWRLFDGVDLTCDDAHMWSARWPAGEGGLAIIVSLAEPATLAMIRVFNFNKNRCGGFEG